MLLFMTSPGYTWTEPVTISLYSVTRSANKYKYKSNKPYVI